MRDVAQAKSGLELIGVTLAMATFITVAIATYVVASDTNGDISVARSVNVEGSPLRGVFN